MKERIFSIYKELNLGNCDICKKCKAANNDELYYPVSVWTIGNNFQISNDRILFVGKTARGGEENIGPLVDNSFIDATEFGEEALDGYSWPYYSYTKDIISRYFGNYEDGKMNIAFTNLVKCNNGTTNDTTIWETKLNCLEKLGVVWREIEVLKPKRIIFYTHKDYDFFIEKMRPTFTHNLYDVTDKEYSLQVGQKHSYWWHRDFIGQDGEIVMSFLRLSHPERKNKEDYVSRVVQWLIQTKNNKSQ